MDQRPYFICLAVAMVMVCSGASADRIYTWTDARAQTETRACPETSPQALAGLGGTHSLAA